VDADLRFHPADPADPAVLSRAQVERFNKEGYLLPFRFFEPAEMAEIRGYFDALWLANLAEGKDSYSISSAHLRHGRVMTS